jgi:hypothetical protein
MVGNPKVIPADCSFVFRLRKLSEWVTVVTSPLHSLTGLCNRLLTLRRYHHIGIPTTEAKPGETHLKHLKVFVVSHEKSEFGVEWMRFEADAAVPDLVRTFRTSRLKWLISPPSLLAAKS